MADDTRAYLRSLAKRGYDLDVIGSGHVEIAWQGAVVATSASTSRNIRGLRNLQARVRAFEQGRAQPRAVRKPKRERGKR
jgi:hypothetical protein